MIENLTAEMLDARPADALPLIIDFYADWCGPCRMLPPIIERVAAANEGKVEFAKVDIDAQPEFAARFDVATVPTIVAIKGGEVVHNNAGLVNEPSLKAIVEKVL